MFDFLFILYIIHHNHSLNLLGGGEKVEMYFVLHQDIYSENMWSFINSCDPQLTILLFIWTVSLNPIIVIILIWIYNKVISNFSNL